MTADRQTGASTSGKAVPHSPRTVPQLSSQRERLGRLIKAARWRIARAISPSPVIELPLSFSKTGEDAYLVVRSGSVTVAFLCKSLELNMSRDYSLNTFDADGGSFSGRLR